MTTGRIGFRTPHSHASRPFDGVFFTVQSHHLLILWGPDWTINEVKYFGADLTPVINDTWLAVLDPEEWT